MTATVGGFAARQDEMVDAVARLVRAESPSTDHAALERCAEELAGLGEALLGVAPVIERDDGVPRLFWRGSSPRVLVLGHYDTVWPVGTIRERDFVVRDSRAYGPGVFDMKAGLVLALFAVAATGLDGVELMLTGDEEIGSPTSERAIRERAASVGTVLVAEPAAGPALKTERKGTIQAQLRLRGRAAHAGLEPGSGVSTTLALGPVIERVARLADPGLSTTVTPTLVRSGVVANAVPDAATVNLDVRAWSGDELDRVAAGLEHLGDGVRLEGFEVVIEYRREPMTASASAELFGRAREVATGLALPEPVGASVGGCSDGNLAAAEGARTLDGLGAVGEGAHAVGEYVELAEFAPRAAVLAGLVAAVRDGT